MATATNPPQVEAFYDFASKRSTLFAPDVARAIAVLTAHTVYRWLRQNPYYRAAEKKLAVTAPFQEQLAGGAVPPEWELLWFASMVAQGMGEYYQMRLNPRRSRVITKRDCARAFAAASTLSELIERGLEVGEVGDTASLYELLGKVPRSPPKGAIASRKAGSHVPRQTLARVLNAFLQYHYGVPMPAIVHLVVQIVEPTTAPRVLRRQVAASR